MARGELDAVVVGGGDGSIRTVASVLVGTDVPLGIIPLGTLNHFAKDLRIPLIADRAVAVLASGKRRYVDVGEVNGEIFINNSSIGSIRSWFLNESEKGAESDFRNGQQLFWPCREQFGTYPCSSLEFVFKVSLKRAEARACSSETTSIVSPYQPSADVIDLIEVNCASTSPRRKVRYH